MNILRFTKLVLVFVLLSLQNIAHAHKDHEMPAADSVFISATFDVQGSLWRVSSKDGFIWVDKSTDLGKSFGKAVKVNSEAQNIANFNESRPRIATDAQGVVYVTWGQNLKTLYASNVWFARSIDGGKSFEKPYIIHQNRAEVTHAFNTLNVTPTGSVTVLWVDGRDAASAKAAGKPYTGLAIYYAQSNNSGKSFNAEQKLADSSCECCRIATTSKPDGTVIAMWRHVFDGNERDHMIAEIPAKSGQEPILKRATYGHWKIDGCPHQGGALAVGGEGKDWWGYHMVYFDGNDTKPGLYYSRMDGVAWASSVPKKFGSNKNQAARPAIASVGDKVWLVWREMEGKTNAILGMYSDDGGKSWSDAKQISSTTEKSDYPHLLSKDGQIYLVWNTAKEGLKVLPL